MTPEALVEDIIEKAGGRVDVRGVVHVVVDGENIVYAINDWKTSGHGMDDMQLSERFVDRANEIQPRPTVSTR